MNGNWLQEQIALANSTVSDWPKYKRMLVDEIYYGMKDSKAISKSSERTSELDTSPASNENNNSTSEFDTTED